MRVELRAIIAIRCLQRYVGCCRGTLPRYEARRSCQHWLRQGWRSRASRVKGVEQLDSISDASCITGHVQSSSNARSLGAERRGALRCLHDAMHMITVDITATMTRRALYGTFLVVLKLRDDVHASCGWLAAALRWFPRSLVRAAALAGAWESTAKKDWQLGSHSLARATPSFQLTELLRATANTTMQTYFGSPLCAASRGCGGGGLRRTLHPVPCRHLRRDGFAVVRRGSSRVVVRCSRVRSSNSYVKAFWAPHLSCRRLSQAETRCASASESQRCSTLSGQSLADRRILSQKATRTCCR